MKNEEGYPITLAEVVLCLENTVTLIEDLTCSPVLKARLIVGQDNLSFVVRRGAAKSVHVLVTLMEGIEKKLLVASCVAERSGGGRREAEDLGDLRDCICSHLVPSLRALILLKSFMLEALDMEFCPYGPCKMLVAGQREQIQIWLDPNDMIKVKGGLLQGIQTFAVEGAAMDSAHYYFYEDPFAPEPPGSLPALMPGTMQLASYVMGSMGHEALKLLGEVQPIVEVKLPVEEPPPPILGG
jgi:hypothetical protein